MKKHKLIIILHVQDFDVTAQTKLEILGVATDGGVSK